MSVSSGPSLPKPPPERTFVFAVTLLSVVALIQIAAVVVAVAPNIRLGQMLATAAESPEAVAVEAAPVEAAATPIPASVIEQINRLFDEADELRNTGQTEQSLERLMEASKLAPDEPMIWFHIGMANQSLGRNAEAAQLFEQVASDPRVQSPGDPVYAELLQQARAALASLGAATDPAAAAPSTAPEATMRDEVGIPIGSVMGIVETRIKDGAPGEKKLNVATKVSSTVTVEDPLDVQTMVYFFEQNDYGDIMQTQSQVSYDWLTPPIDWSGGQPELLEVTYPLPQERGDLPPLQFHGYVVGVYYKGELQDFRAEPAALADQFPLKFNMTEDGQ